MQNAKDSFYIALRNRLATVNPTRTVVLRSVARPGIVVEENEIPLPQPISDVFVLRWTGLSVGTSYPMRLSEAICEIHYVTAGSSATGGMDRGRSLARMDAELLSILTPQHTPKADHSRTSVTALATNVFWSDAVYGAVDVTRDRLSRVVKVTVYSYQEPGEL